ncbi:MAG: glycosyltransferase family 4 protein [Caulobacteraceae bacterium]
MKVLLVHNFYQQPGGEDAVVRQEEALLKAHGVEVVLHTVHSTSIQSPLDQARVALSVSYNRRARDDLRSRLEAEKPDVMHVHNFFPLLSPSIFDASAAAGVASVFTLHNFRILCPTAFLYHDEQVRERSLRHSSWWTVPRRVYRDSVLGTLAVANMVETHKRRGTWRKKVDRFIALTPYAKTKFIEGGVQPGRISVKGNAVVGGPPASANGERRGGLFVGRLSSEKGVGAMLEAWRGLPYPLRIIGDGPMADQVARAAGPWVTPLGRLSAEEVRREMEAAAFLILPSVWYEMFPLAAVEAMAAGLPILASDLGGLDSIVTANQTGLLFRVADPVDLEDKVRWAVANPQRMAQMGEAARQRYLDRHTPAQNYERLMEIYREAMAAAAERRGA